MSNETRRKVDLEELDRLGQTNTISFRVSFAYYFMYHQLPDHVKKHIKDIVMATIRAFYEGKPKMEKFKPEEGGSTVVNLNINISHAEAKAENKVTINIKDIEKIIKKLEKALEFPAFIVHRGDYPPIVKKRMKQEVINNIKEALAVLKRVAEREN